MLMIIHYYQYLTVLAGLFFCDLKPIPVPHDFIWHEIHTNRDTIIIILAFHAVI